MTVEERWEKVNVCQWFIGFTWNECDFVIKFLIIMDMIISIEGEKLTKIFYKKDFFRLIGFSFS